MSPPTWWLEKHLRTVRWYQYENGKRVEEHRRRQSSSSDGVNGAAKPLNNPRNVKGDLTHGR